MMENSTSSWKLRTAKASLASLPRTYQEPTDCEGPYPHWGGGESGTPPFNSGFHPESVTCSQKQNTSEPHLLTCTLT